MAKTRSNTKNRLIDTTIKLAASGGNEAATIQAIASDVGITEAAIYRHFASKEELRWAAYKQTVEQMIHGKELLVESDLPLRQKILAWVRLTYAYFDKLPDAFTYVLLTPQPKLRERADREITTRQGALFLRLMKTSGAAGEIRDIKPEVALSHFTGLMLNVPRLIREGALTGPATQYADEVAAAVWCILRPHPPNATADPTNRN